MRSGEFVDWDEIMDSFINININSGLKLFLSVGACFGVSAIQIIDASKRAPFLSLLLRIGKSIQIKSMNFTTISSTIILKMI